MDGLHLVGPRTVEGPDGIEVSAEVHADGEECRLWFHTSATAVSGLLDPFLAACLVPAMKRGQPVYLHGPASAAFLAQIPAIQRVFQLYRADVYHADRGRLRPVPVVADEDAPVVVGPAAASFFSAGVDSFYTALTRRDAIDTVLFVDDFDARFADTEREAVADNAAAAAGRLGLRLVRVGTNAKDLLMSGLSSSWPATSWRMTGASLLEAVALLHAPTAGRVIHPSSEAVGYHTPFGGGPWLDPLYSAGGQVIEHDDIFVNRLEKIRAIAGEPVVQEHLRVCWQPTLNCGRCPKCVRTMLALEALGVRDRFVTFPPTTSEELAERVVVSGRADPGATARFYDEIDDYLDDSGHRPELRAAIAASRVVERSISREEALVALSPMALRRAVRRMRALGRGWCGPHT